MKKFIAKFRQEALEPFFPFFLGIHGNLMLFNNHSNNFVAYAIVELVLLVGLISFFYKKYSSKYMLFKYLFFSGSALVLIYLDGGVGSFFTIWLFLLALYVLYLEDRTAIVFAVLVPILYVLIDPFSTAMLSDIVVIQRSIVIMATGLIALSLNRNLIQEAVEKERTQQNLRHLERSNKDLEQYALVTSHDLKAPLQKIIQSIDFIESHYGEELNPEIKNLISISKKSSLQMNNLITDILTFSKVTISEKDFAVVRGDEIVKDAIHNLSGIIKNRHAEVEVNSLPSFYAIGSLITSVFQNLIHNAIKFNNTAVPKIHISGRVENENEVLFSITDNGIGIEEKNKDKIFSLFQRLENGQKYPGTGVGLALCKRIVELHNGEIWFESKKDFGSTFFIRLSKNVTRTL